MIRPFLKWAGSKYQLLPIITKHLPKGKRLVEPFVGSGAVFLNTQYSRYLLADSNKDIINLFNFVKNEKHEFIKFCQPFFHASMNQAEKYYQYRDTFNQTDDTRLRAALFLYLNRHCYNGLCRYNSSGGFNVPFGRYRQPMISLESIENFLSKGHKTEFLQQDFVMTFNQTKKGDVIYCDPPYVPLTDTAFFENYTGEGFGAEQQIVLAEQAQITAKKGIPVLISNHDTDFTRELYQNAEIISFPVKRMISPKATERKRVQELLAIFT